MKVPKDLQGVFTQKEFERRGWNHVYETNRRNKAKKLIEDNSEVL